MAAPWTDLQDLSYTYDDAGNILTLTDGVNSGQVQSFGYDWLDRLTSASTTAVGDGQYSRAYAYDAIGNIISFAGSSYTYSSTQPHAVTSAHGNSYAYDANGNQTSRTMAFCAHCVNGGTAYTVDFDDENRLTAVKQGGTLIGEFVYDAAGGRVVGTVNGATTVYIGGVYEWQAGGGTTSYYRGPGGAVAFRRSGYASDNGVYYLLRDHLGSSSVIVDSSGTIAKRELYYPFGGNRGSAFSDLTTQRFTGQYHEQGLPGGEGLSYYNARWYDAQLGRFVSADTIVPEPSNPQAFNRYAYTLNNPVRYTDPTDHYVFKEDPGVPTITRRLSRPQLTTRVMRYRQRGYWYDDIPRAHRNTLRYNHIDAGTYADWGGNARVQRGWRDPATAISSVAGGARLGWTAIRQAPAIVSWIARTTGLACADGDCGNESRSVWTLNPFDRGVRIEQLLGRSNFLAPNFPTIDRFENGVATSIKSIDLTSRSYQNTGTLTYKVQGYVNSVAQWQGQQTPWRGVRIYPSQVNVRVVELAIPNGGTPAQMNALQQVQQYAAQLDVQLKIVIVP